MRFARILMVAGLVFCSGQATGQTEKPILKKEPTYQSQPYYCLLAFGQEPKFVWVVLDGDVLYVDKNGNGDLTEPGERLEKVRQPGNRGIVRGEYDAGLVQEDARAQHRVFVDARTDAVLVAVELQSGFHQAFGAIPDRNPVNAPVLFFNRVGMQFDYLTHVASGSNREFRRGVDGYFLAARLQERQAGNTKLRAPLSHVATDGKDTLPANVNPVADIEFPAQRDGKPIHMRVPLNERFQGGFIGTVDVPQGVGLGNAKVTLSFPDYQGGAVAPFTFEVPVIDAEK